jgi:hypothetical protein
MWLLKLVCGFLFEAMSGLYGGLVVEGGWIAFIGSVGNLCRFVVVRESIFTEQSRVE